MSLLMLPETFSGMIEMEIKELLPKKWLTFQFNSILEKWRFKDSTERNFILKVLKEL